MCDLLSQRPEPLPKEGVFLFLKKKREIHNEEKRKREECSIEDYKEEFMFICNNPCSNLLSVKSVRYRKSVRAMKSVRGTKTELDKNQFIHL